MSPTETERSLVRASLAASSYKCHGRKNGRADSAIVHAGRLGKRPVPLRASKPPRRIPIFIRCHNKKLRDTLTSVGRGASSAPSSWSSGGGHRGDGCSFVGVAGVKTVLSLAIAMIALASGFSKCSFIALARPFTWRKRHRVLYNVPFKKIPLVDFLPPVPGIVVVQRAVVDFWSFCPFLSFSV